ncbi:MAG TPA: M43 family zinc metalloprotease [Cytophagaceae bacterium]
MKKNYLIGLLLPLLLSPQVEAQHTRKCLTAEKNEVMQQQNPSLKIKRENLFNEVARTYDSHRLQKTNATLVIPVVVHIVYKDIKDSLSEERIRSQINVLNEDFKRLNADKNKTPTAFKSVAADCEIEFKLANVDPNGNPTKGITYRKTYVKEFPEDEEDDIKFYYYGGTDAWNPNHYLNIWVGRLEGNTLGYAYFPEAHGDDIDGVVISPDAFGVHNKSPYNLGRTATHEVGHYLGLEHIWGNVGCSKDDGISDTPLQYEENYDCPSFPKKDNCTSTGNGVMFMNYMDYTNDACMNLFTLEQKNLMRTVLTGTRKSLLTSPGIEAVSGVKNMEEMNNISIYPNPAKESISISFKDLYIDEINLINSLGEIIYKEKGNREELHIPCSNYPKGIYTINILTNDKTLVKKLIIE